MIAGWVKTWLIVVVIAAVGSILWFAGHSATKVEIKRYELTGTVVSVQAEAHTVNVHNEDMPGFMKPMNMDYSVRDAQALYGLKPGDVIHATLLSDGHSVWQLENVGLRGK